MFKKVVLPEPVPPLTKMLYPACTYRRSSSAASFVMLPQLISWSMVRGQSGNLRIVTMGPFSAMGESTTLTRLPFCSLASTMGDTSFTVRLQSPTIRWIICSNFSSEENCIGTSSIRPLFSTKMWSGPFIIISVMLLSSIRVCKISSLRREQNISRLSFRRISTGYSRIASSRRNRSSIWERTSSSVVSLE